MPQQRPRPSLLIEFIFFSFAALAGWVLLQAVFDSELPPLLQIEGFIGIEELKIISSSAYYPGNLQNTDTIVPGVHVADNFIYFQFLNIGDWIEFELPKMDPGKYLLSIRFARGGNFGIVTSRLNGHELGQASNLFNPVNDALETSPMQILLSGNKDILRFEIIGTDPSSKDAGFHLGIDGIILSKFNMPEKNDVKASLKHKMPQ